MPSCPPVPKPRNATSVALRLTAPKLVKAPVPPGIAVAVSAVRADSRGVDAVLAARAGADEGDVVAADDGAGPNAGQRERGEIAAAAGDGRGGIRDPSRAHGSQDIDALLPAAARAEERDVVA